MEIIIHRVNTIRELKSINKKFGTEIDIRVNGSDLILNHEPFENGEKLIDYLDEYQHGTLILNIKEDGIETEVLRLVEQRTQIISYFLLDVEFPYLYRASREGERNFAIRFSEDESIETVKNYIGKVDWVWIDTNTKLPITNDNKNILNIFKKCLVCPERWGRPEDISYYKHKMKSLFFNIDSVMTSKEFVPLWID
jgi:hypothetical protein